MPSPALPVIAPLVDSDNLGHLLAEACSHNNRVTAQRYLDQGASPYSTSHLGSTAWETAMQRDMNALLPMMLAAGLSPTEIYNGQPLLLAVMINGSLPLINDLILRGADPAVQDRMGRGMVYLAVYNPDINVLRRAIELNPGQLNERIGRQQDTALHQVAFDSADREDLAELLLVSGIDPTVRDIEGRTAVDVARQENHPLTQASIERAMLHATLDESSPSLPTAARARL